MRSIRINLNNNKMLLQKGRYVLKLGKKKFVSQHVLSNELNNQDWTKNSNNVWSRIFFRLKT